MKIIHNPDSADLAQHARELVRHYEEKHRTPKVAAVHRARVPHTCDDCQETYWLPDNTWGSHWPCKGEPGQKKDLGFGA